MKFFFRVGIGVLALCLWGNSKLLRAEEAASADYERFTHKSETFRSDFETNLTIMEGDVVVESQTRKLTADRMEIYGKTGRIVASGKVSYTQDALSAQGARADMNIRTGLGFFEDAVVRLGESLYLEGKKIERYEGDRFRVEHGKVSTCQDCPQSWSVTGAQIDVRIEGYAEVHHALIQIKDTPIAYIPILVFPVKTKRQSGVLPPKFRVDADMGFQTGIPYFWAISRDADMTFEYRPMTAGGNRLWHEFRYAYSPRSYVNGAYSLLKNNEVADVPEARWGTSFKQRQQFGKYFVQRYVGEWASDPRYTRHFEDEFDQNTMSNLSQEFSLAYQRDNYISVVRARFNDDNIPRKFDYTSENEMGVESRAVHSYPDVELLFPSYGLWGPLRAELSTRYMKLERPGRKNSPKRYGALDPDTEFIRTGERGTMETTFRAPMRSGAFLYKPLVHSRFDGYRFPEEIANPVKSTWRWRNYFEQQTETDIWRVYKVDNGTTLKAIKHSIVPNLRWSYSPRDAMYIHPFYYQKDLFDRGSPKFDLFDPDSDIGSAAVGTVSEEQRLTHHHFITAGINTRVIARYGDSDKSYVEHFGAGITQDFNFLSNDLGRMGLNVFGAYGSWKLSTAMSIDTRNNWNANATNRLDYSAAVFSGYVFQRFQTGAPSFGAGAALAAFGAFSLKSDVVYDLRLNNWQSQEYSITYRGPSKCWIFELVAGKGPGAAKFGLSPSIRPEFYKFNVQYVPGAGG